MRFRTRKKNKKTIFKMNEFGAWREFVIVIFCVLGFVCKLASLFNYTPTIKGKYVWIFLFRLVDYIHSQCVRINSDPEYSFCFSSSCSVYAYTVFVHLISCSRLGAFHTTKSSQTNRRQRQHNNVWQRCVTI